MYKMKSVCRERVRVCVPVRVFGYLCVCVCVLSSLSLDSTCSSPTGRRWQSYNGVYEIHKRLYEILQEYDKSRARGHNNNCTTYNDITAVVRHYPTRVETSAILLSSYTILIFLSSLCFHSPCGRFPLALRFYHILFSCDLPNCPSTKTMDSMKTFPFKCSQ